MTAPAAVVVSPYLTLAQVVEYLQLPSAAAVYRLIYHHRLPFCRLGRRYRFDRRELDAWVRGFGSALEQQRAQFPDGRRRSG